MSPSGDKDPDKPVVLQSPIDRMETSVDNLKDVAKEWQGGVTITLNTYINNLQRKIKKEAKAAAPKQIEEEAESPQMEENIDEQPEPDLPTSADWERLERQLTEISALKCSADPRYGVWYRTTDEEENGWYINPDHLPADCNRFRDLVKEENTLVKDRTGAFATYQSLLWAATGVMLVQENVKYFVIYILVAAGITTSMVCWYHLMRARDAMRSIQNEWDVAKELYALSGSKYGGPDIIGARDECWKERWPRFLHVQPIPLVFICGWLFILVFSILEDAKSLLEVRNIRPEKKPSPTSYIFI